MDVLGERVPVYQSSPICAIRCFYTLSSKMDLGKIVFEIYCAVLMICLFQTNRKTKMIMYYQGYQKFHGPDYSPFLSKNYLRHRNTVG